MGKKSSIKGSEFERKVCRDLSWWASYGRTKDVFWRTPGSGARASQHIKRGRRIDAHCGDISAMALEGEKLLASAFVECKHVRDLQLARGLCGLSSLLLRYFAKAKEQAERYKKLPILIARQNRFPILFVTVPELGALPLEASWLCRLNPLVPYEPCDVYDYEKLLQTVSYDLVVTCFSEVRRKLYGRR